MNVKSKLVSLLGHVGVIKYLSNTSWLFGEKILRMTVGLYVGIWVARYLGPEQFGLFSYAQSLVALFVAFSILGLDSIVVKALVNDEYQHAKLLGTSFALKLLGSFFIILLLAIITYFQNEDSATKVIIFIIASATVFQSFNVIDFYFQSLVLSKFVVYSNALSLFFSSLIKITLILNEAPVIAFAYVVAFESSILACGYVYFYYKKSDFSIFSWEFDRQVAIYLMKNGWPLILSILAVSLYMKIDQVMIKEMLGSYDVGLYSAALRLSEACYFIPMVISSSLFPAIINAKKKSENLYYSRLQNLFDLMALIAIFIAVPMSFMSEWLILKLYGEEFQPASGVLMLHIWSSVFVFFGVASSKWFVIEGLQKYSFYRTAVGAAINIILNFILIPKYSIYGAAFSTLISQFLASYLFFIYNSKSRIIFKLQTNSILLPLRKAGVKFG